MEIYRDGGTGAPDLTGQPVLFVPWKGGRDSVHRQGQFVRLLPNFQFAEIFHAASQMNSTGHPSDDHVVKT